MSSRRMILINKPIIGNEEIRSVVRVLRSGVLTEKSGFGPQVMRFENAFAKYIGTKFAIALNSGTSAIHSALIAAGVGEGDEVIVPSFTFVATAEMVSLTGARPVFVEIDPHTYCLDPEQVEDNITNRTKAIIPVHLYGLTANMDAIIEKAHDKNIVVIEDAAQAHGAEYKNNKAGKLGDIACFSFYGNKNMTTGEGGMITTNSLDYAEAIRSIRNHGDDRPYKSVTIGHNYRMTEIEAAIGLVQLHKLPKFVEARRKNAELLLEKLRGLENLQLPTEPEGYKHAWYVFTIRLKRANAAKRNKVVTRIRRRRIDAKVYYPIPVHSMPYYKERFGCVRLRKTETTARQVFSLPVHPGINEEHERIVKAVKFAIR